MAGGPRDGRIYVRAARGHRPIRSLRRKQGKTHIYLLNVAWMANCRERCSSCRRRSAGRKARDDTILGGVDGGGVGGGGGHSASCKYNRSFFRGFFDFRIASFNSSLSKGAPVFGLISSNFGSTFSILYLYLSIRCVSRGCFQGQSPISTISFGSGSFTFFGVRRSMTFFFREAVSARARILSSSVPPRSTCAEHLCQIGPNGLKIGKETTHFHHSWRRVASMA